MIKSNRRVRRAPADLSGLLDQAAGLYAAGRLDEAARAYVLIERSNPADVRAAYSIAVIDIRRGRMKPALERLRRVVAREPALVGAHHNLGYVSQSQRLWPEAVAAYRQALALQPGVAETLFNLAVCLTVLGRTDEAVEHYRALDPAAPQYPRALTNIARLKPSAITPAELSHMRRAANDDRTPPADRTGLWFSIGEVLESRGEFDAAFAAFATGNRLKYAALAAMPETDPAALLRAHAASIDHMRRTVTAAFLATHRASPSTVAPIFIVGMPRSGSTLIEQILASHPHVQGLGEGALLAGALDAAGAYDPGRAKPAAYFRKLAEDYLARIGAAGWRRGLTPVDKTLESYLHVGMIHMMFPRAVILNSVRDPIDTGLACYRQLFEHGNETLYDLAQIGAEYRLYRAAMDHWADILPGRVIDVGHEALVRDPETQIRWLVTEACGLDWDPACLDFHRTERPVTTASLSQVRQPMFDTSIQRWTASDGLLAPLLEALVQYAA